jgi:hypothetical protein
LKNWNLNYLWKLGVLACVGTLLLFFNNCKGTQDQMMELQSTSGSSGSSSSSSSSPSATGATGTLCEQDIKNLYARGWQKFLMTNCSTCHSNGPGKGRFANSDLNIAYAEFDTLGYVKVAGNAVNASHNPPYTGVQHTQTVNDLKAEWQTGLIQYATCTGSAAPVSQETQADKITLTSSTKTIGLAKDGDSVQLVWTINSDLSRVKGTAALPNISGGKFALTVTRLKNGGGFTYYTFSSPTVYGAGVDTRIEGIFVNLNGLLLNYPTTFSYVDKSIRSGSGNDLTGLISTGALVAPKVVLASDQVSISFINISQTVLPPAAPPTSVNILGSKTNIVGKGNSYIDISLALSSAAIEPIVVTLNENTDLCGTPVTLTNSNTLFKTVSSSCLPDVYNKICPNGSCTAPAKVFSRARSDQAGTYTRYDWDYKFPVNSVTFKTGESTKTLRVYFSRDVRYENNRVLSFDIASILGPANVGSGKSVDYIINKYDNPVPDPNVATFSELMNPASGILGQNCTMCHNSKDLAGGYNMSDYDLMINNKVLIPYDLNSKMYLRMHPTPEFLAKPMPLNGFLETDQIRQVSDWIKAGAPNN